MPTRSRMYPAAVGSGRYPVGRRVPVVFPVLRPTRSKRRAKRGVIGEQVRRGLNFVATLGLIIVTAPAMMLIAIAVKLTSPGPIFYTQPRVGLDRRSIGDRTPIVMDRQVRFRRQRDLGGSIFQIYKFRTMVAEPGVADQVWASRDDPRVTQVGRFLRRTRLDELPQLFNILKGEMNLVGPRPEQPEIFAILRGKINNYQERQRVLPGITGWAQVNQAYDQDLDDVRRKTDLDLEYLRRRSPVEDVRIMLRTVPVMVLRRGSL